MGTPFSSGCQPTRFLPEKKSLHFLPTTSRHFHPETKKNETRKRKGNNIDPLLGPSLILDPSSLLTRMAFSLPSTRIDFSCFGSKRVKELFSRKKHQLFSRKHQFSQTPLQKRQGSDGTSYLTEDHHRHMLLDLFVSVWMFSCCWCWIAVCIDDVWDNRRSLFSF